MHERTFELAAEKRIHEVDGSKAADRQPAACQLRRLSDAA
jgi:hypothetical protein